MMLLALFVAFVPAVFIVWLILSKKTKPALKKFLTITLIAIGLVFLVSMVILLVYLFFGKEPDAAYGVLPVSPPGEEAPKKISAVFIAAIVVFVSLILVSILAMWERRKK